MLARNVVAVEEDPELARRARAALVEHGIASVSIVEGPLAQGYRARAPYDVILFAGAVAEIPAEIASQLAEGGRLVAVIKPAAASAAPPLRHALAGSSPAALYSMLAALCYRLPAKARFRVLLTLWSEQMLESRRAVDQQRASAALRRLPRRWFALVSVAAGANADPSPRRGLQQQSAAAGATRAAARDG